MNRQTFVIIGAGLAGASAVTQLRKEGFDGAVVLVGEEPDPPYERPPLSKAYLRREASDESIAIQDPSFYTEHDVDLRLSTRATLIRPAWREVLLDDGSRLRYDRLLIATGSSPRRLDLPGHDLPGIHHLRTRPDSAAIREAASRASRVAVIGAGWIGSEVAASLRQLGLPVAMIGPDATPLERVLGPEVGTVFRDLHADHGVDLVLGQRVAGFEGVGAVGAVRTRDGRRVAADLVVVGIGARPRVELAVDAGLDVSDGILVDEYLESSVEGIFAAGDVAEMWHPALKARVRVEHQDNARRQGRAAARNMLGQAEPYVRLPYFYSDQYDLGMEYRGYAPAWGTVVTRGDLRNREFLAFWLADGRVIAAMNANVWDVGDDLQQLVDTRPIVDPERLADPVVPLDSAAAAPPHDRAIPSAPSPVAR